MRALPKSVATAYALLASLHGRILLIARNGYAAGHSFPQASLSCERASPEHILQAEFSSDKGLSFRFRDMSGAVTYLVGYAEVHGTPAWQPSFQLQSYAVLRPQAKNTFSSSSVNHTRSTAFNQSAYLATPTRPALIYQPPQLGL